jgi:hypothetical protein
MPKSFTHLWEQVIDFETLFHAYKAACRGKRYRWESLKFRKNLEENLIVLQNELIWGIYRPEPYRQFMIYEPKPRLISAPAFRDRVVHHALCRVIEPVFENRWLKEDEQVQYYARYMDDFVIIHHDKQYLRELLGKIENYLHDNCKLNLNPKTGIFPGKHGIDFCGYRIWPTHVKPRKSTVKRAKRRLRKMARDYKTNPGVLERAKAGIQSFLGYVKHCNGWRTTIAVLERAVFKTALNTVKKPALPDNGLSHDA